MKRTILLIIFVLLYASLYSQGKVFDKDIMTGVYANAGLNKPVRIITRYITEETSPWYGYESWSAGVKVSGMLSANYRIEIAACYSGHSVGFELSPPIYTAKKIYTETFGTVTIPVTLKRYLQNNYFFSAGTIVDFAMQDKPVWLDAQTGFGLTIGVGKEIRINNFNLDLAPGLELHSLVPFYSEDFQQRLVVAGLRIGFSYDFPSAADSHDQVRVK